MSTVNPYKRLHYGVTGSNPPPCKPDCKGRNAECHGNCEAYLKWRAAMNELIDKRNEQLCAKYGASQLAKVSHTSKVLRKK